MGPAGFGPQGCPVAGWEEEAPLCCSVQHNPKSVFLFQAFSALHPTERGPFSTDSVEKLP